jgi:hypothetical protein
MFPNRVDQNRFVFLTDSLPSRSGHYISPSSQIKDEWKSDVSDVLTYPQRAIFTKYNECDHTSNHNKLQRTMTQQQTTFNVPLLAIDSVFRICRLAWHARLSVIMQMWSQRCHLFNLIGFSFVGSPYIVSWRRERGSDLYANLLTSWVWWLWFYYKRYGQNNSLTNLLMLHKLIAICCNCSL